jgi:hypothetical protein
VGVGSGAEVSNRRMSYTTLQITPSSALQCAHYLQVFRNILFRNTWQVRRKLVCHLALSTYLPRDNQVQNFLNVGMSKPGTHHGVGALSLGAVIW